MNFEQKLEEVIKALKLCRTCCEEALNDEWDRSDRRFQYQINMIDCTLNNIEYTKKFYYSLDVNLDDNNDFTGVKYITVYKIFNGGLTKVSSMSIHNEKDIEAAIRTRLDKTERFDYDLIQL